jgi:phosphatidylethanolamine/phosphatidyl-N-methylethanolamine N-methyltransferase
MAGGFDKETVTKAYGRWAPVYDLVFGKVFAVGRAVAVEAAERIGGHILEVGVGTGISLPQYSRTNRVVGLDISLPMLLKAQDKIDEQKLSHVDGLAVMDAARLGFRDASFDVVVGQYLITAVPDPEATLDEFVRVLKPGGQIILVNHLTAESGLRRLYERAFGWDRLARWLERRGDIALIERRPIPPLGHFSLIRFGRRVSI